MPSTHNLKQSKSLLHCLIHTFDLETQIEKDATPFRTLFRWRNKSTSNKQRGCALLLYNNN